LPTEAAATVTPPIHKREPAVFATAIVTLLGTVMYLAPSVGIAFPDSVAKIVSLVLTIAAGFGIRSAVKPV
jgi:hypothetical protein